MSAIAASDLPARSDNGARLLSARSTQALFARLRRTGDPRASDELVKRFLPLARKLARRYSGGGEPLDDLVQVASLALVKAVQRYDESRGASFTSYAVPTITGELKRYFRDKTWAAHVPRGLRDRAVEVDRAIRDMSEKTGHAPTARQIAERLELDVGDVLDALQAHQALASVSLDAPAGPVDDDEQQSHYDTIGSVDQGYELAEDRATISRELVKLPARERRVLHMRFVEDRTQSDIAAEIGVSQMQVSRMLRRTLDRLADTARSTTTGTGDLEALSQPRVLFAGCTAGYSQCEPRNERSDMSGITDKVTGRIKKAAGDLADDAELRRDGRNEERKGEAKDDLARDKERAERHAQEVADLERKTS